MLHISTKVPNSMKYEYVRCQMMRNHTMMPSSTRVGPSSARTRPVHKVHRISFTKSSPHSIIPTSRFRPTVVSVPIRWRPKISLMIMLTTPNLRSSPHSLTTLRNIRDRFLLPAYKSRSQMWGHEPVRLWQRRLQRWRRIHRRWWKWGGGGGSSPSTALWTKRDRVRFSSSSSSDLIRCARAL